MHNCPKLQKVWDAPERGGASAFSECTESMSWRDMGKSAAEEACLSGCRSYCDYYLYFREPQESSKGVMLTQNNLASNVEAVKISAEPGTAMLSVLPIHHAFCLVTDWLKGFSQGATICINDSLLHMVRHMSIFKPDIMLMVPMMIETIGQRDWRLPDPEIPKAVLAEKSIRRKTADDFYRRGTSGSVRY